MKGLLRAFAFFLLFIFGLGAFFYLREKWQRIEKHVVVIMRSSNEDCDEFRCNWQIDRVLQGNLTSKEATAFCYLINTQRSYSRQDSVEWIKVEGGFTHENKTSYVDCVGTLVFRDKTISPVSSDTKQKRVVTAHRYIEQPNQKK